MTGSGDDKKERYLLDYLGSVETSLYKGNIVLCQAIRKISLQGETLCQPRSTVLEISDKGMKMLDKSKTNVSIIWPKNKLFKVSDQNYQIFGSWQRRKISLGIKRVQIKKSAFQFAECLFVFQTPGPISSTFVSKPYFFRLQVRTISSTWRTWPFVASTLASLDFSALWRNILKKSNTLAMFFSDKGPLSTSQRLVGKSIYWPVFWHFLD